MPYHRVFNKSNKTGTTSGARTTYVSGASQVFCSVIFSFLCVVLCRHNMSWSFWPFVLFLLTITLSILWFTVSDYLCGIFIELSVLWFMVSDYLCGILTIELSVLWFTVSDYLCGILTIALSVLLFTVSDYLCGILTIEFSVLWFTVSDYLCGILIITL